MHDNTRFPVREATSRTGTVHLIDGPAFQGMIATAGLVLAWALTAAGLLPPSMDVLLLPAALLGSGGVVAAMAGGVL